MPSENTKNFKNNFKNNFKSNYKSNFSIKFNKNYKSQEPDDNIDTLTSNYTTSDHSILTIENNSIISENKKITNKHKNTKKNKIITNKNNQHTKENNFIPNNCILLKNKAVDNANSSFTPINKNNITKECHICCDNIYISSIYSCKHEICYKCSARLLFLYKNKKCPICKESQNKPYFYQLESNDKIINKLENENIRQDNVNMITNEKGLNICTNNRKNVMNSLHKEDDNNEVLDKKNNIFPTRLEDDFAFYQNEKIKNLIEDLICIKCINCQKSFKNKKELEKHFKIHNSLLCITCLENNHLFWHEIKSYSPEQLFLHRKGENKELGFEGHIYCIFCNFYLYDKIAARNHCIQNHQICTVCDILGNRQNYYKDFTSLQQHYRAQHYCCSNSNCIRNMSYVFPTKSELWAHYLGHHGIEMNISKIFLSNNIEYPSVFILENQNYIHNLMSGNRINNLVKDFYNTTHDRKKLNSSLNSLLDSSSNSSLDSALYSSKLLFPTFSSLSLSSTPKNNINNVNSSNNISHPDYLNRSTINQESKLKEKRINKIKSITNNFIYEINEIIENFLLDNKSIDEMVREIEDCVGPCLKILESVDFDRKSKIVNDFIKEYKNKLKFPSFSKNIAKENKEKKKKEFKILSLSDFKGNKK